MKKIFYVLALGILSCNHPVYAAESAKFSITATTCSTTLEEETSATISKFNLTYPLIVFYERLKDGHQYGGFIHVSEKTPTDAVDNNEAKRQAIEIVFNILYQKLHARHSRKKLAILALHAELSGTPLDVEIKRRLRQLTKISNTVRYPLVPDPSLTEFSLHLDPENRKQSHWCDDAFERYREKILKYFFENNHFVKGGSS